MIPISIDTGDIAAEFNLNQQQVDEMKELAVKRVAVAYQQQWKAVVGKDLKQARELYKDSIKISFTNSFTAMVYLDPRSWLSNALEMGYSSFDMKTGFLKSKKIRLTSKGNPYITIPFRFGVPTTIGDSSAFSGILPEYIHKVAKSKSSNLNRVDRRLTMTDIPSKFHIPKSNELRGKISQIESLSIEKRTSIYEGLEKTGGGYMTFRRVSLNSQQGSWIHPGFKERNLANKALQAFEPQIGGIVGNTVDDFLDNLGL